jgi:hypothetical protein
MISPPARKMSRRVKYGKFSMLTRISLVVSACEQLQAVMALSVLYLAVNPWDRTDRRATARGTRLASTPSGAEKRA